MPAASKGFWVASTMNGLWERHGVPVCADLTFLHGLEQGRLSSGRGPVELVGHQQVGEDRSRTEDGLTRGPIEDHGAGDVGRQKVGGELHPAEGQTECLGQCLGQGGLAQSRQILNQQVALGQQAADRQLHGLFIRIEHGPHRLDQLGKELTQHLGVRPCQRRADI